MQPPPLVIYTTQDSQDASTLTLSALSKRRRPPPTAGRGEGFKSGSRPATPIASLTTGAGSVNAPHDSPDHHASPSTPQTRSQTCSTHCSKPRVRSLLPPWDSILALASSTPTNVPAIHSRLASWKQRAHSRPLPSRPTLAERFHIRRLRGNLGGPMPNHADARTSPRRYGAHVGRRSRRGDRLTGAGRRGVAVVRAPSGCARRGRRM